MARITRRRVLKLSGAGVVAAQTGGLAAILATGRAPAYAQGTNIHWLRWADFVPASDVLLKGKIAQECQKTTGITLMVETINANDLQSRIASAIQSGTGADITMALGNWPQLYAESLADAGDVAEEIGKAQGGYYDVSKLVATVGNKWIGLPWVVGGGLVAYRKSWFEEIGYNTFPETWDALLDAGKKLKTKGRPIGQTAGHTFGDAPGWWYPYLWSWGGKEVEADGKTVVLNSRETIESVKFAVGFWKDTCDEGGLAWTTPTTTAPSCRVPSAPPTTAPRSTLKPSANPKCIRPRRERRCGRTSCTRASQRVPVASLTFQVPSPTC
jgi:ABC-type glycerol-3-phosphate transport system substrate-binding protein